MTSVISRDIFLDKGRRVRDLDMRLLGCFLYTSLLCPLLNGFPYYYKGLHRDFYFWLGISGSVGFFLSVLIHELFHILGPILFSSCKNP